MSNLVQLRRLLDTMQPIVEPTKTHEWTGPSEDQSFAFLQRAVVVRQWEALHAISALADNQSGHFGVTFLRPAYEELVWLEYLLSIPDDANRLVLLLAVRAVGESVTRQENYLGATVARNIGWTRQEVAAHRCKLTEINAELRAIGQRLGWNGPVLPSFEWLSRCVGKSDEYRYLYHATSSYVHFSPHELLRRVWGEHGTVSVGSSSFAHHWEEFSAYWSMHTFVRVLATVDPSLLEGLGSLSDDVNEAVLEIIAELREVPIVTTTELEPWLEPSS